MISFLKQKEERVNEGKGKKEASTHIRKLMTAVKNERPEIERTFFFKTLSF